MRRLSALPQRHGATEVTINDAMDSDNYSAATRAGHLELEKKLYGSETIYLLLHQRKANADRARTKAAILVAGLVLAACSLSWKALQAFIQ